MTNSFVTSGIVVANALAVVSLASAEINPIIEYIQNGASVGAIMGIFLWREMKRAERYEHLYDQERKLRLEAENKCANCPFVKRAHEEFMDKRVDEQKMTSLSIENKHKKMQGKVKKSLHLVLNMLYCNHRAKC